MKNAISISLSALLLAAASACSSTPPPPPPRAVAPPPAAPSGPTRTDFKYISSKLMQRCVAGGWINEWRSKHEDVDVARPKIHLETFEDKTDQDLDQTYLHRTLEQRMRLSGVYDMVSSASDADFVGRGKLLRMAERSGGERISVYTAVLDLVNPKTNETAYTCEATVRGEM